MDRPGNRITLVKWRRDVGDLYSSVREISQKDPELASIQFRKRRDELFSNHPQSPLTTSQRSTFQGLNYFPYDSKYRTTGSLNLDGSGESTTSNLGTDGIMRYTRVALINFELLNTPLTLELYWIEGYGGGIFLPFLDLTNGKSTYMAGRYLFDTIKGVDLGIENETIPLDFNYAYNPSCAYNDNWICPLPPRNNHLSLPVEAGERSYPL
jgi:hypothetical protein